MLGLLGVAVLVLSSSH